MAFEDILVSLTTYPERTRLSAIEDAVSLAVALESRVSAIACEVRVAAPASPIGSALLNVKRRQNGTKCSRKLFSKDARHHSSPIW